MKFIEILKFCYALVFLVMCEARSTFRSSSLSDQYNTKNNDLEVASVKKRFAPFPGDSNAQPSLPTTCIQDGERCPYVNPSYRDYPDLMMKRSLAPFYYWEPSQKREHGSHYSGVQACCACRFCLNPNNTSQSLQRLRYYTTPVYYKGDNDKRVAVGCTCVKARPRGK